MGNLNDIDVGTPLVGATLEEVIAELRSVKATLKTVLLHAHKPNGAIVGTAVGTLGASTVGTDQLQTASVTTEKLADASVTVDKIPSASITGDRMVAGFITPSAFSANCIPTTAYVSGTIPFSALIGQLSTNYIENLSVTNAKLADAAVTDVKVTDVNISKLVGTATANQILKYNGTSGKWEAADMPTISGFSVALFGDQGSGEGGEVATASTWNIRNLSEMSDPDNIIAITANKITLPAGTYFLFCRAPAWAAKCHQIRLVHEYQNGGTQTEVLAYGSSQKADSAAVTDSTLFWGFVETGEAGSKYYIEHYFEDNAGTNDLGWSTITAGSSGANLYTSGFLIKLPG